VALAELGLRVKRPETVPKKTKLLPLLQADVRFKFYEAPTQAQGADQICYLAVAVTSETGQLAAGSITLQQAMSLLSSSSKGTAGAKVRDDEEGALEGALEAQTLPPNLAQALIFVCSPQTVKHAGQVIDAVLARAAGVPWAERSAAEKKLYVLGLDTEWRPSFKKGEDNRTSILQLAFAQQLLIFDMHWIYSGRTRAPASHASHASNADALPGGSSPSNVQVEALNLLRRLLSSPCYLKLGFGFQGDLDKLFKDYSSVFKDCSAVSLVEPFLDLQVSANKGQNPFLAPPAASFLTAGPCLCVCECVFLFVCV